MLRKTLKPVWVWAAPERATATHMVTSEFTT